MGVNCSCDSDLRQDMYNASKRRKIPERQQHSRHLERKRVSESRRSESHFEARSSTFYSSCDTTSFDKLPLDGESPNGSLSEALPQQQRVRFKTEADLSIVHALLQIGDRVQMTNVTTNLEGKTGVIVGPFSHFQNRWEVHLEGLSSEVFVQPRNLRKLPTKSKYEEVPFNLIIQSLPISDSEKHTAMRGEMFDFMNIGRDGSRISIEQIHIGLISAYGLHGFNFLPYLNLAFKALWKNRLCEEHMIDYDLFKTLLTALHKALILRNKFYRYRDSEYFEYLDFRRSLDLLEEWGIQIGDCKEKYNFLEEHYYLTFDSFCVWAISQALSVFGERSPKMTPRTDKTTLLHANESNSSQTGSSSMFREP